MDSITPEQFAEYLREALGYLHDPYRLRRSPLARLFGVENRHDTPTALRRILTEAITALEPASGTPDDSRAWRMYEAMTYRYIEQYSQEEVANQMGLSTRQVRREQGAALEALAYQLWSCYDLGAEKVKREMRDGDLKTEDMVAQELGWLCDAPAEGSSDLLDVLPAVISLVEPLAVKNGVSVKLVLPEGSLQVAIDPVPLRQILLHLLTLAIGRPTAAGPITISARVDGWDAILSVVRAGRVGSASASAEPDELLGFALQLAEMCGCRLEVALVRGTLEMTLRVAAVAQVPVLVVDDNEGTQQLVQRFLQGTRYRSVPVQNSQAAVAQAAVLKPAVVILDVMMPRVDGWEVLGRLREHPQTESIPVVVCTILAQEELAVALGAAGFLRKPFNRESLLAVLDSQMARRPARS